MKTVIFSSKAYDKKFLNAANKQYHHELVFVEAPLNAITSQLAAGFKAVCVFVNDDVNADTLKALARGGARLLVLRCAGFNNVDLIAAKAAGITVLRVPAYSPHGVAEHAAALILALNRKICRANSRIHDGNFAIDGLLGFELNGCTVGIMGTGKIGMNMSRIMTGFGSKVLAYDVHVNPDVEALGVKYVSKAELFMQSDVISLHLPLMKETRHVINKESLAQMKDGVMLINTSRGGLIQSSCLIEGLKSGKIGYLGLDVYEEEEGMFFEDHSGQVIQDDTFARLLTFSNVIITGHQAFFTSTALTNIAQTTLANIKGFEEGNINPLNLVSIES